MKPRMMSPNTDILTTPKQESLKTPKFREFTSEIAAGLSALRSPRDVDSLNTPLALTTPLLHGTSSGVPDAGSLSTPTLTTPRTADWGLFSPINLGSNCSSPRDSLSSRDNRPADLPLDSSIGLSSPHDGVLAKRRKAKNWSSSNSRSVESDSNSCDTPTTDGGSGGASVDIPRDLSKKSCDRDRNMSPSSTTDLDTVRDRVGDVKISSSPKWFKHPKHLPSSLQLSNKELISDMPSSYHPSPLAVPSPNWTAIRELLSNTQTPKVLDNFVFDVLPPNTPTAKSYRERSPEPINYEKHKVDADHRLKPKTDGRVTFAEGPRPGCLTPPPPIPVDLSNHTNKTSESRLVMPKQEFDPEPNHHPQQYHRHSPPSPPPYPDDPVKEEPREYPSLPPGFPPYYLPDIAPGHLYASRQSADARSSSPPASPPRSASNHYQQRPQFYGGGVRHGLNLSSLYDQAQHSAHAQYNSMWGHEMGHVTMPTPPQNQNLWSRVGRQAHHDSVNNSVNGTVNMQNCFNNLKPNLDKLDIKSENRLSTDSQDSLKKKSRKIKQEEPDNPDMENSLDGQPPKKKGKGKGKNAAPKDPNAPKRVFVCPHCNRSYDWNYNLNRHLKYECGKENAFMCSKCGRKFPHKQNCVYHLKRKHKIVCETVEAYVASGLVVFTGSGNPGSSLSPSGGQSAYSPKEDSVTPPPINS